MYRYNELAYSLLIPFICCLLYTMETLLPSHYLSPIPVVMLHNWSESMLCYLIARQTTHALLSQDRVLMLHKPQHFCCVGVCLTSTNMYCRQWPLLTIDVNTNVCACIMPTYTCTCVRSLSLLQCQLLCVHNYMYIVVQTYASHGPPCM